MWTLMKRRMMWQEFLEVAATWMTQNLKFWAEFFDNQSKQKSLKIPVITDFFQK